MLIWEEDEPRKWAHEADTHDGIAGPVIFRNWLWFNCEHDLHNYLISTLLLQPPCPPIQVPTLRLTDALRGDGQLQLLMSWEPSLSSEAIRFSATCPSIFPALQYINKTKLFYYRLSILD